MKRGTLEMDYLVVTDEGAYDGYQIHGYRCTAVEAKRLNELRIQIERMIRERRYPPHWNYGGSPTLYISYAHEHVRIIQRVGARPLKDNLTSADIADLLVRYERDVAEAPKGESHVAQ